MNPTDLVHFLFFFCIDPRVTTATAITIGAIPAVLSIFLTARFEWNKQRGLETAKYLAKDNPLSKQAFFTLQRFIGKEKKDIAPALPSCYGKKDFTYIFQFANIYEDLFVTIRSGLISETQIRRCEESTICDFFSTFHGVLNNYRKEKNRPTFFENYELGYLRWKILKLGPLQKITEIILNKPLWRWTKFRVMMRTGMWSWNITKCEMLHKEFREGKKWYQMVGLVYGLEWFGLFWLLIFIGWLGLSIFEHLPLCS